MTRIISYNKASSIISVLSPLTQLNIGNMFNRFGIIAIFFSMMLELKEILLPSY